MVPRIATTFHLGDILPIARIANNRPGRTQKIGGRFASILGQLVVRT